MFEEYLQDAYTFYSMAKKSQQERETKMFFRSSVFCAASALEAFVNFIGDTLSKGGNLDKNELAFLNDKILEVSPSKAQVEEKSKYFSIDNKLKFIIKKFNVSIDVSASPQWSYFSDLKTLRDRLIHSRDDQDNVSVVEYEAKIKNGLNAHIDIMNAISQKLFTKPLRRSLTDLKL